MIKNNKIVSTSGILMLGMVIAYIIVGLSSLLFLGILTCLSFGFSSGYYLHKNSDTNDDKEDEKLNRKD